MPDQFSRTRMLIGEDALARLRRAKVILFGLGGVGSFAAEALARAGVGRIGLVDSDVVDETNLNRQLVALRSTIGMKKVEVMRRRIADINPDAVVETFDVFFSEETAGMFDFGQYSYALDAVDTVRAKLLVARLCRDAGTPLISCMGTGNRLDPTKLAVGDVFQTSGDPLARIMRRELRKIGITSLKAVYSTEAPRKPVLPPDERGARRHAPGSVSFVPPAAGMMLAGAAVADIVRDCLK